MEMEMEMEMQQVMHVGVRQVHHEVLVQPQLEQQEQEQEQWVQSEWKPRLSPAAEAPQEAKGSNEE